MKAQTDFHGLFGSGFEDDDDADDGDDDDDDDDASSWPQSEGLKKRMLGSEPRKRMPTIMAMRERQVPWRRREFLARDWPVSG